MAVPVIMPKAGMAMEEGTVVEWLKKEGDMVEAGDPLLEIATDKVNMEIEATDSGVLLKILKGPGEVVPVTQTIAYIGKSREEIKDILPGTSAPIHDEGKTENLPARELILQTVEEPGIVENRVAATPLARTLAVQKGVDLKTIIGTGHYGEIKARDVERQIQKQKAILATPLAKKIAVARHIDLSAVQGSGPGGRILRDDVLLSAKILDNPAKTPAGVENVTRRPLQGRRKIIADRMLQSHLQAPPVTLNVKADVTELVALRKQINESLDIRISFNDFILKATAIALAKTPGINVSLEGDEIVYKTGIHLGMAVAVDDGILVPVIKDADTLSLKQIAQKAKELAAKAREEKLTPDECSGGTFTVSNLGMYDIVSFTPLLNPPESAILGVCTIENELKMIGEKIENRKVMGLSLTIDHRIIDGAQGAVFLQHIKFLLENPLEIVVS